METVVLQNLSIGYIAKGNVRAVASGLNASIESGQLTCLLGRNGIGKSTLLRTLSAFQPKLSGAVRMGAREISDYTNKELSREIGVVLTEKPEVQNMTVEEMVALGRSPYTGFWGTLSEEDYQEVQQAMMLTSIQPLSRRMIHTLSDGERQKVMIAKALAQKTPVIYLDEPTAFLDFPSKVEVLQLLRRIAHNEEKTIFLSTHDVELALQVADCIWLMNEQGLQVGTPRQLADNGVLSHFIERPGIRFDREQLTIHIHNNEDGL